MKLVELVVTESGAVYVNDTRITDRSTKPWGGSPTLFEGKVPDDMVVKTLVDNGYKKLLSKIDTEPYLSQSKSKLEK
jgi:hypothetical protein